MVVRLGGRRGHDVEPIAVEAGHRHIALDPAARRAHLREAHASRLGRQAVRAEPVEPFLGARAGDLVLREARLVEHADRRPHGSALLADSLEPVAAAERVDVARLLQAVTREPERTLPAEAGAEHRTPGPEKVVQRVGLRRPSGGTLLLGIVRGVLVPIALAGARDDVAGVGGVLAEAPDVELPHAVARLAVEDPLGQVAARTARVDDAEEREAGQHPEVAPPRDGAHERAPIRRVSVGPVDRLRDRRVRKHRHAPLGRLQVLRDAAQVGAQEPARPAARHAVQRPGARVGLERAEKQPLAVLAHVERSLGIAEHGQLRRTGREPGDRLGEHVLVLERDDRQLEPERPAELARPHAGRDHHVAGADSAARGLEEPPALVPLQGGDGGPAQDPRPAASAPPRRARSRRWRDRSSRRSAGARQRAARPGRAAETARSRAPARTISNGTPT